MRFAIIGAGLAGLAAGCGLAEAGHEVEVFEKSRGVGGRAATRRYHGYRFDHGAQYFTAHSQTFRLQVSRWIEARVVAPWKGVVVSLPSGERDPGRRYVGVPRMSSVAGALAASVTVRTRCEVVAVVRTQAGWLLTTASRGEQGPYDVCIIATQAEQARPLLAAHAAFQAHAAGLVSDPCWATLAVFEGPVPVGFDAALISGGALAWVAAEHSKPGRPGAESWVLQADPEWSRRHLEQAPHQVADLLLEEFFKLCPARVPVEYLMAHRWRYARPSNPLGAGYLWDPKSQLGVCGDWCSRPRLEDAFLGGLSLAEAIG